MIRRVSSPAEPLSPEDAVLAIIAASANAEMHGKKRVRKSVFLYQYYDASIAVRFSIQHFGV
jgi:hypothetical protein